MKKIAVGSKNPTKIKAVQEAFMLVFPDENWEVIGIEVDSGISNQPMSDRESIRGARNRAKRAMRQLQADFGVGLEGGLHKIGKRWFDSGWIIVRDNRGREGIGSSIKMEAPIQVMKHIYAGKELGIASDIIFGKKDSGKAEGQFGLMTKNAVTRMSGYRDGVISALSRFVHPHLFEE